jgi:hypothetical protein
MNFNCAQCSPPGTGSGAKQQRTPRVGAHVARATNLSTTALTIKHKSVLYLAYVPFVKKPRLSVSPACTGATTDAISGATIRGSDSLQTPRSKRQLVRVDLVGRCVAADALLDTRQKLTTSGRNSATSIPS